MADERPVTTWSGDCACRAQERRPEDRTRWRHCVCGGTVQVTAAARPGWFGPCAGCVGGTHTWS